MQDRIYHCPPNPTADGITVAEVTKRHGVLRSLWPFQSARHHWMMAVLIGVPLALGAALLSWLDPGAIPTCVCSGFVGAMYTIYWVVPARLRLTTCGEARHFIGDMDKVLVSLGYGRSAHPDDPARHHYRLVRLWSWLEWSNQAEADIEFRVGQREIVIDGPILILRWMRLRILRRNEA